MNVRIDEEKVKRIADHYGWNNQLRQLAEIGRASCRERV